MKFAVGWAFKLSVAGAVYFVLTAGPGIKLPEKILGFKVPPAAQEWVDRNAQIADFGNRTQAGFKDIADSLK
jgi:hypothetical protein